MFILIEPEKDITVASESDVIVYLDDQTSIYEYTNIRVEELPEELQNEIREGKRLEGKDKLYGFLENYSS